MPPAEFVAPQALYRVLLAVVAGDVVQAAGDGRGGRDAARRASLERMQQDASSAVALLTPAYRDGRFKTDPLSYIEVLRESAAIAKRFGELGAPAQREILVFTKPPYAVPPAENVAGLELLTRGVVARSVYELGRLDRSPVGATVSSSAGM